MKTLLVPLDFSDATETVLAQAAELATPLSAQVILLHIAEPIATYVPVGASMDVIAATPPPIVEQRELISEEQRLTALADQIRAKGISVTTIALIGLPVDDILSQAKTHHADLIVLGSHGHGALYHLFGGSVVTGVLKRAECPVLVVPIHRRKTAG